MIKYTLKEREQIIQTYYEKSRSLTLTIRELRNHFPRNQVPAKSTVQSLVARFVETGSVGDLKKSPRPRTARSNENVVAVAESVRETPGTSIRHRSQELNISRTSLQRILTKDLHFQRPSNEKKERKDSESGYELLKRIPKRPTRQSMDSSSKASSNPRDISPPKRKRI